MRRFLALLFVLLAAPALAETYPERPVRIIVPTPAGGPVDVMARLVAAALPASLGQNVIVENKPGAGNTLGSDARRLHADGIGGERAHHQPDNIQDRRLTTRRALPPSRCSLKRRNS